MERNKYIIFLYAFKTLVYKVENTNLIDVTSDVLKANEVKEISQYTSYDKDFDGESIFSPAFNRLLRPQGFHYYFEKFNILASIEGEEVSTRRAASIIMCYQNFLDRYDPTKKELIALVSQNSLGCLVKPSILNKQFKWNYPFNDELGFLLREKGYKNTYCINEFSLFESMNEDNDQIQLKEIFKFVENMLLLKYPVLGKFRESAIKKLTDAFAFEALVDKHANKTTFQDYLFELTEEEYEQIRNLVKETLDKKIKELVSQGTTKRAVVILAHENWIKEFIENRVMEYKNEYIDVYNIEDILPYLFEYQLINYQIAKLSENNNHYNITRKFTFYADVDDIKHYKYLTNIQKTEVIKLTKNFLNKLNNLRCK